MESNSLNVRLRDVLLRLEAALGQSVGWNVIERATYVRGPLPWRSESAHRPWTDADYEEALKWLGIPSRSRFVRRVVGEIAREYKYMPEIIAKPRALARLSIRKDDGSFCWQVQCPYCGERHRHSIPLRYQLNPLADLHFRFNPCREVQGARGYMLIRESPAASDSE